MPNFIGRVILGSRAINEAATGSMVELTYSQARKLPASVVWRRLNTNNKGGPGRMALRWYDWYATPNDIIACPGATRAMVLAAAKILRCGVTDRHGVTHATASPCVDRRSNRLVLTGQTIDCMTCLVFEVSPWS